MSLLFRWLLLRAVDEEPTPDPEQTLDDIIGEDADPEPIGDEPSDAAEIQAAKRREKQLEADLAAERAARAAAEERARSVAPRETTRDPDFDREEQELAQAKASGAAPEAIAWLQWKVDQTRSMRATKRNSDEALSITKDAADRSDFARLEFTKPALFKRYNERVEKAAAEWRSKGQLVPRAAILRLLVGDDMINGKVKPKAKAAESNETATVPRGQPQQARSDVQAKSGRVKSIKDKRDWANTPI